MEHEIRGERSESHTNDGLGTVVTTKKGFEMSKAIDDVVAERKRQIEEEGWTEAHDDQHDDRSLALAGARYAHNYVSRAWIMDDFDDGADRYKAEDAPYEWPTSWHEDWWKPKNPRRDLVRAAALLIAEIERLDRAATKVPNA